MNNRLDSACIGQTYSKGGLNVTHLRQFLRNKGTSYKNLRRNDMLKHLCGVALPSQHISASASSPVTSAVFQLQPSGLEINLDRFKTYFKNKEHFIERLNLRNVTPDMSWEQIIDYALENSVNLILPEKDDMYGTSAITFFVLK